MKILIVCSGNAPNFNFKIHQAFIYEQVEAVKDQFKIDYDTYFIKGKGIFGYLENLPRIIMQIKNYSPDIIHAHFGLSGLISCLQRIIPVVITFHGSDAYISYVKVLSKIASHFSAYNIFVGKKIKERIKSNTANSIIPCGIDFTKFYPIETYLAKEKLNLSQKKNYILFASRFDNPVKNYPLAFSSIERSGLDIELIELKSKEREEVNLLLNACCMIFLTSFKEGSPQIIKEAMACNCPIVATDVGDIREMTDNIDGCYITSFNPAEIANKLKLALEFGQRTNGREKIRHLDNRLIAKKIMAVYNKVIAEKSL